MVNRCSVVTELLCARLGSQLYPRLIQKWSWWAQHPAWLNCQAAHSLGQTCRRAGCEHLQPAALYPRKKSPLFEISLVLFPFFFFLGSLVKLLWCICEPWCFEMHLNFFSFFFFLSQLKHPLQLLGCVVCLSKGRIIIRILTSSYFILLSF